MASIEELIAIRSVIDSNNRSRSVLSSEWTLTSDGLYEYVYNHGLKTLNVEIELYNVLTNRAMTCSTESVDDDNIKVITYDNVDTRIVIFTNYYKKPIEKNIGLNGYNTNELDPTSERGYVTPELREMIENTSTQLETMAYRVGLSIGDYGGKSYIDNPTFDNSDIIQGIIDLIATFEKGGSIILDNVYGISKTIELKPKVSIISNTQQAFFNGMLYSSSENLNINTPRLKAINTIDNSMLLFKNLNGERRHIASYLKNLILDCNNFANHGLSIIGKDSSRQEDNLLIENLVIQGAKSHGLYMKETLANKIYNLNVSACGGYGIYNAYGVCDSILVNPYIHTNQLGGIYYGSGSSYYQVQGGKIEDNYGNGIDGYQCSEIIIDGTQFHRNNGYAIKSDGLSTEIFFKNGVSGNPNISSSDNQTHFLVSNNGVLHVSNSVLKDGKYIVNKSNGGIFYLKENDILGDLNYASNISSVKPISFNNVKNGVIEPINNGSIMKKITIQPNSNGSVVFEKIVDVNRMGTAYFAHIPYLLIISAMRTPNTALIKSYTGLICVGKHNTTYGISNIAIIDSNDTNWINSVSVSLENNSDITINITTGANVGEVSGYKDFYFSLIDIGGNSFNTR